jgi:hypothetical protein
MEREQPPISPFEQLRNSTWIVDKPETFRPTTIPELRRVHKNGVTEMVRRLNLILVMRIL